ncbi:MAG: aminotransferase class V-fold PLP-dependent enzyme [Bacteroidota bacterium]
MGKITVEATRNLLNETSLETYFAPYRENILGVNQFFETPYGRKPIIYADWTASGRLYGPIESRMMEAVGPFVGNTHTETTVTGTAMTQAYHQARHLIKQHVNAGSEDVLVMTGSGMTGAISKFQRILGLKAPEQIASRLSLTEAERPIVFVTHMEHHSNHTSWLETLADVECIMPDEEGRIDLDYLRTLLDRYRHRPLKIAAVTAGSNVSGVQSCYRKIARIMHEQGGCCFVDFACAGPYVEIDMHPKDAMEKLDAIYFSPHKFLGGPGTPGVLVFDSSLYKNRIPDHPGGGTVTWTNPWGEHAYIENIEVREDGGTPPFLQTIKAALAMQLKAQMGVKNILKREKEMNGLIFPALRKIPGLHILADNIEDRLGIFSFYIDGLHYNLGAKLLNDRYGIQVRGGCSCAGTYGHHLLEISRERSSQIRSQIELGINCQKPGWIRMSIHPTMSNQELQYILSAIHEVAVNHPAWGEDYRYDNRSNEYIHLKQPISRQAMVDQWFTI